MPNTITKLYIWSPSSRSKYGHISIATYTATAYANDGAPELYASFFPEQTIGHTDVMSNMPACIIDNLLDDLNALDNDNQPADIILEISDLDIVSIHAACELIRANLHKVPYSFLHPTSVHGLNCASFVNRLLRAGSKRIDNMIYSSTDKLFWPLIIGYELLIDNDKINYLLKLGVSHDIIINNTLKFSFLESIDSIFSFNWFPLFLDDIERNSIHRTSRFGNALPFAILIIAMSLRKYNKIIEICNMEKIKI